MNRFKNSVKNAFGMLLAMMIISLVSVFAIPQEVLANDIVVVNATDVNVRSLPNTSSQSYGKVNTGMYLTRYESRTDGWSCIDYAGTKAYIKSSFLTPCSGVVASQSAAAVNGTGAVASASGIASMQNSSASVSLTVWIPQTGSKYHKNSSCSGMKNPSSVSIDDAKKRGYTACKKCYR